MQPDDCDRAKALIFELSSALRRAGRDDDVLSAFSSAYPAESRQHVAAMQGDREAAAIALTSRWPEGGNALSEYALGSRASVLAGIQVVGLFIRPAFGRSRK